MRRVLPIGLLLVACGGPGPERSLLEPAPPTPLPTDGWSAVDANRASALQAKLDQAVEDLGLFGATMGVAYGQTNELWTGASGQSDRATGEAWIPTRAFRIGSVTKTFTAAGIYLLIEEGVVSLSDPLEKWVPGYYDGLGVTLEHLISNTSGIVSYNYVGSFDDTRPWTPRELVEWAVLHESTLRFTPGTQWEYSNTNYALLGLVIEAASGTSYETFVGDRLLQPSKLADTYVAQSGDANANIVGSYAEDGSELVIDPSFGWAAGSIVSTPNDLARWGNALFGGDVLEPRSLTTMLTPVGVPDANEYAHGAFVEIDGEEAIYGHTGGIGGHLTYMYYYKTEQVTLVVMTNRLNVNLRNLSAYGWSVVLGFEHP